MLDNLRKFATTLPGKILGGLLLIGLAGFGVTGFLTSVGLNTVAKVGGQNITTLDFQRSYQSQVNAVAQQIGQVPTAEQALAMGIPTTVLNRIAVDKALNQLGANFGLGVSDTRIAESLRQDPSFGGTLGGFEQQTFELVLQQNGYTESEFFQSRREAAWREQLAMALFGEIKVPDTVNRLVRRFGEDRRTINYVVLSDDNLLPVAEPTEEEITAYLDDNQVAYRTQETRNIAVMVLTPDVLASAYEIPEAEVEAEYERTKQNYVRIERRTISQVPLPADATVRWFELGKQNGKSFETLVAESGLAPTELGSLVQAAITDNTLSEAAFSLEEGEFAIVPGIMGQRAVYVSNIEPGGQMSFEEARDQVDQRLRIAKAREDYIDVLDNVEEQRAAFVDLPAIAADAGLEVVNVSVTANGAALEAVDGIGAAEAGQIAQRIFASQSGQLAPSVSLGANKTVWFDLLSVDEARDQTLDEVRDAVVEDIMAQRQDEAMALKAGELVAAIASGEPFESVAVANNLFPQISQPFGRQGDGTDTINAAVAAASYNGGVGHIGSARDSTGQFVIFEVTSITPAEEPLSEQEAEFIANSFRNNVYAEFAGGLRDRAGMQINQEVLRQVLGIDG